jgi:hypothetical protein
VTTENSTNIKDLISLIRRYFPSNLSYDDPAYQSSVEHQRLLKRQKEMLENTSFIECLTNKLEQISYPYPLINWINLEEYPDIEYKILLHKNQDILDNSDLLLTQLKGVRRDIFLWVSIIGKYYYYSIEKMIKKSDKYYFCYDVLHEEEEVKMTHRLEQFFMHKGYAKLPEDAANYIIEDIETELSVRGETTIFKCLFNDLWTNKITNLGIWMP